MVGGTGAGPSAGSSPSSRARSSRSAASRKWPKVRKGRSCRSTGIFPSPTIKNMPEMKSLNGPRHRYSLAQAQSRPHSTQLCTNCNYPARIIMIKSQSGRTVKQVPISSPNHVKFVVLNDFLDIWHFISCHGNKKGKQLFLCRSIWNDILQIGHNRQNWRQKIAQSYHKCKCVLQSKGQSIFKGLYSV